MNDLATATPAPDPEDPVTSSSAGTVQAENGAMNNPHEAMEMTIIWDSRDAAHWDPAV